MLVVVKTVVLVLWLKVQHPIVQAHKFVVLIKLFHTLPYFLTKKPVNQYNRRT